MPRPTHLTALPAAHPFEPTDASRRCASCDRRRKYGLHKGITGRLVAASTPVVHVSRYRTSGLPQLARPSIR